MVDYMIKYSLKEKILKLLIENKQKWTILEISKKLGVDYKNTFQAINNLYPNSIIKNKKGNINLVEIKLALNSDIFSLETKRTTEFAIQNPIIKLIKEDIARANYPFVIALIFGSFAKGNGTNKSDVDICIISDNSEKVKKIISNLRLLPYKIDVHQFSPDEFDSMLNKREENISKEITKNNYILYGIEGYYRIVSRWMKKE